MFENIIKIDIWYVYNARGKIYIYLGYYFTVIIAVMILINSYN